jgi:neutral ceramidase
MIVGTAQLDITPEPGIELSGFAARPQPSTGVLDPLTARALYLEDGAERLLWLHADVVAVEESLVAELRTCIERELGIPGPRILISATHTHSGPPTVHLTGCGQYDARYVGFLKERFLDAARRALTNCEPCCLVTAEGRCELGVDRRRVPSAHTDPRVAAVGWRRADGTFKAVLLNYAMHGVCLFGTEISADWPGAAARTLSQSLPGQPTTLVFSGASGNVNPPAVGVSPGQMRDWGRQVAESVLPGLLTAMARFSALPTDLLTVGQTFLSAKEDAGASADRNVCPTGRCEVQSEGSPMLRAASTVVPLPVEDWTVVAVDAFADRCLADEAGAGEFGDKYRLAVETWRETMLAMARRGKMPDLNAELTVVVLGPVVLVAVNAELFSRFNGLIATDDGRRVCAVGCTNGMLGYLPTLAAYSEGGYEIDWSMLFYNRVRPKAGALELLAEEARRLVAHAVLRHGQPPTSST